MTDLLSGGNFHTADLYRFTLADGSVYRYTSADADLLVNGETYLAAQALFERSKISWKLGLEVDQMSLTAHPRQMDLVNGVPFCHACEQGMFDGATVVVSRTFMPIEDFFDCSAGSIILLAGRVGDIGDFGATEVPMTVKSFVELIATNLQMPRNIYQFTCCHTVYDMGCGLSAADFKVSATVGAGSTVSSIPIPGTGKADGYFDLGYLVIGGLRKTIKKWAADAVVIILPFASAPPPGATVDLYPGCYGTLEACTDKFDNLDNFRGFPFIPVPETAF